MSSFKFEVSYRSQKKLVRGQQRAEKAGHFKEIQLEEHLAADYVNWHHVCNMISCKRDVLEKQSLSEVKMGRGSPICERVCKMIMEYFKNNLCRCQIANALQISSCTVHNIIKYSEKLEKSLCVRDKVKDLCRMPVVFRPSDNTASFVCIILSLTLLNVAGIIFEMS